MHQYVNTNDDMDCYYRDWRRETFSIIYMLFGWAQYWRHNVYLLQLDLIKVSDDHTIH